VTVLGAVRGRLGRRAGRDGEGRMSLADHLYELRSRLVKALLGLLAGMILAFVFYPHIFAVLKAPYCSLESSSRTVGGTGCNLFQFTVFEGFTVRLRVAILVGALFSAPVWLYQLWSFITPGLHRKERRWAVRFVAASVLLFAAGAAVAYYFLRHGLKFLLTIAGSGVEPVIGISSYLSFVTTMLVIFGVSFEFPLLVVMLNLAGVLSYERLRAWRRMEIFLVTVFAATATPTQDPFSMLGLAVPMWLLYEVALVIARAHDRGVARRAAQSPYAGLGVDEPSPLDETPSDLDGSVRLRR
jgi:sec-independent protein translocase protein TatC